MGNANKQHGIFNRVEKPLNIIDRISNDRCNPINFLGGFQLGQSQRTVIFLVPDGPAKPKHDTRCVELSNQMLHLLH